MTTLTPEPAASSAERTLTLTRVFDAPRRLVFEMWTKGEHLSRWSAPGGFTMRDAGSEIRPGGAWHICMISPTGEEYRAGGVYREIVQDELLVFTHAWEGDDGKPEHETQVTVRFADCGANRTEMRFEQACFKSVESRDSHAGGWSECFDKLADLLAEAGI